MIYKFADFPAIAKESKEHGLDELVYWFWVDSFSLPLPAAFAHLGGDQGMADAARECKKLGVNITPFVSVELLNAASAPKYGAQVDPNAGGWTYHTDLIPRFNPPYAHGYATVQVGPLNPKWQEDVLVGAEHLADMGIPSFCWDVFITTNDPEPNQISLAKKIRDYARSVDPQAVFSAEELYNIEVDAAVVDYTWNWTGYRDLQALTSVLPVPRINCNVSSSALVVKQAFADSLYLNVMPRKPESINGTDSIASRPTMSKALKQCARLRKQFLSYFVDGTLIGDCIFTKPCSETHTCAYVLPDRAIIVMINLGKKRAVGFDIDMAPWTKSPSGRYEVKQYDADAKVLSTSATPAKLHSKTKVLDPEEVTIIEIAGR